ncbi:AMP-binding protein [Mariniflexile litorale]|uniref:AMP-binding protein n=1 Tax=Mariniflexile litorale TaxID=3045158 RepID=A0AAU7EF70_9FLAO|nr:AMP-binding protein [Mariniflexile sp. KMM 9835]MDQ8211522.1 AMP-binding protein [Mariniflexile sp. KMM 9835]
MNIIQNILNTLQTHHTKNAFCINDEYFTYETFSNSISKIQSALQKNTASNNKHIGLITNNDLETYAAIIAIWLEGKAYIPLNPDTPKSRNLEVIKQAHVQTIIDSSTSSQYIEYDIINPNKIVDTTAKPILNNYNEANLAYIFFTSGTTGTPKGVQITQNNLNYFIDAFQDLKYPITHTDKCLQMFDLTFDLSVVSFMAPLISGACIYTTSNSNIKYLEVLRLISNYDLTFTLMVPSILHSLRPFFKKINNTSIRISMFCGEALHEDITKAWSSCVPNALIANVYGPTECTIYCTNYVYHTNSKSHNGILSVGKEMLHTKTIIVDENNIPIHTNEPGELCLSGPQLTIGYLNNEAINNKAFFYLKENNKQTRFYKTGDLCKKDAEGDILYLGRIDFQAKIQGFRVELSEIEYHIKKTIVDVNLVAVVFKNKINNSEIALAIESSEFDTKQDIESLKTKLPSYMIPTKTMFFKTWPLNANGKTNRKEIIKLVEEKYG